MSNATGYSVYGEWFVQEASGCTCYGGDAHYGHEPGCGYEPLIKLDELKAALAASGFAVLELPKSPSEYWGPRHDPQWNHYPYTRVDGAEVEIGARREGVYRVNGAEARIFAADLLAAANVADAAVDGDR